MQGAVCYVPGIAYFSPVPVVRAEGMQSRPGSQKFHVRCRYHGPAAVDSGERVPVTGYCKYPESGIPQDISPGSGFGVRLYLCPGDCGSRKQYQGRKAQGGFQYVFYLHMHGSSSGIPACRGWRMSRVRRLDALRTQN